MVEEEESLRVARLLGQEAKSLSREDLFLVYDYLIRSYRSGTPLVSDARFDTEYTPVFISQFPTNPLLAVPESDITENTPESRLIPHDQPMLSMNKAYTLRERRNWAGAIIKAADKLGIDPDNLYVDVTPKLDGMACYDTGAHMLSRGDSIRGEDITYLFTTLNIPPGKPTGAGPGELIVYLSFFKRHLSKDFEHPRNYVVGVKNGTSNSRGRDNIVRRIQGNGLGMAFVPYSDLPVLQATLVDFVEDGDGVLSQVLGTPIDILLDGACGSLLVKGDSAATERIRAFLGATSHHNRWQLALKRVSEVRESLVTKVFMTIGRTGKVTPVAQINPVKISGAYVSNVSLFNFELAKNRRIGPGAVIEITRSGEVIPAWIRTKVPSSIVIPETCPKCGYELISSGPELYCPNALGCPARRISSIVHFFKIIDVGKGFGTEVVTNIFDSNRVNDLEELLECTEADFKDMGFKEKTSRNLANCIYEITNTPIRDYLVLAALNIESLGTGLARKIMHKYTIHEFLSNYADNFGVGIKGVSARTEKVITDNLNLNSQTYFRIVRKLRIINTRIKTDSGLRKLAGRRVVFTGTFTSSTRSELEQLVEESGAEVGSSVTKNTSMVVYGARAGSKLTKALQMGVLTVSEVEFLDTFVHPLSASFQE